MNRSRILSEIIENKDIFDVVVIGGGATGLGIAVDAATRGYKVVLFEQDDFAKSTSSRSTKLVHGGVRYLQNGDVALVREALKERGWLRRNAPHLVKDQSFIISNYSYIDNFIYTCGLTLYDMLSWGGLSLGRSRYITRKEVIKRLPQIKREGLKGGVIYHDGQFDDSRLAINLAQTAVNYGGYVVNHTKVTGILHDDSGVIGGVSVSDNLSGRNFEVKAKCVINATGIFVDDIMSLDSKEHIKMVAPSQGTHIVIDKRFLQSDYAVMIPKTIDGRVLFAVPWHDQVVVGTTDIARSTPEIEPKPMAEEIDFILGTAALYMNPAPTKQDILSVFAGQRPLAAPKKEGKKTKEISRSHKIFVSESNLVTITGGKWTTYRRMAEDAIDRAISIGVIDKRKCTTKKLKIHGYKLNPDLSDHLYIYGSDTDSLNELMSQSGMSEKLHPDYPYCVAEVVWAVRNEMACCVDDILSRRVRLLYLNARAAIEIAPAVAEIVAKELGYDDQWKSEQVKKFIAMAQNYVI